MIWNYTYTPQIWPLALTAVVLIVLAVFCWRRRSEPGALPLAFALLFAALWIVGSSLEIAAVAAPVKIFWVQFQEAALLPAATAVTCFLLDYAWPGRWLTRRTLALLSIPCLLNVGMILTNPLHHLGWQGFTFDGGVNPLRGPANWIFLVYAYGLTIVNLVVLAWLFVRSPQHRWLVVLMVASQLGVRVVYMLDTVQVIHSDLPIEVFAFWFPIPTYIIALLAVRIFDPLPLARQAAIEQLHDGMLVLDLQGRVAGLNPAAAAILATPRKQVQGKRAEEILPRSAGVTSLLVEGGAVLKPIEITLGSGAGARCYELEASPLDDFRGVPVGRLLLLHDVTEQKQAQAQLLEQQRALAMLHERERLARELHDSLGQAFAFVNVQGQAIRRLLSRGETGAADECTCRLVEVAREADLDIRESILGLRVALSGQGFFPVLAHYLAQYEKNYGIRAELAKPETMQDGVFEPPVEVQLLRILQEALTNVRKHAGADCVRIAFACEDHCVCVTVQDNGRGFDPGAGPGEPGGHIGLRVMLERAEEAGGSLSLHSVPGQGTELVVRLPVKRDTETWGHGDGGKKNET